MGCIPSKNICAFGKPNQVPEKKQPEVHQPEKPITVLIEPPVKVAAAPLQLPAVVNDIPAAKPARNEGDADSSNYSVSDSDPSGDILDDFETPDNKYRFPLNAKGWFIKDGQKHENGKVREK